MHEHTNSGRKNILTPAGANDISLAQWALVDEIRSGAWTTLDFPRIAREDFNLNGVEFVNTLFEVPTAEYLSALKQRGKDQGVTMVLIMVDDEGDGCCPEPAGRIAFAVNHRKWIDVAHFLGCRSIRTNCRGPLGADSREALLWAEESYHLLLEYAAGSNISVLIENHGGFSNDPDWLVELFDKLNNPSFGAYPDWRSPSAEFDNFSFLQKTIAYAMGMSYRNQPTDEATVSMIKLCQGLGYQGWWGIESSGRQEIAKGISILGKHLFLP